MTATISKTCRTCRYLFDFPLHRTTFVCPACGTVNGRPQAEGSALESLSRATAQRLRCDFHNAVNSYQHVLLDSPEEHEALWGLALCRYGIEYVDDPRTGRRMPTVHSVRRKPMQLDPDYLAAIDCAPEDVRVQYEQEAQYIDDAMARIRELAQTQKPYDVFICHKTTKPDSEAYTEDYNRAFDLYHELTLQGYRVFFAPKEMAGVAAGSDYEAAIYHALDTAKVMLLICSDADCLTSAWVRSEWTRFLEMADETQGKCLLPLMYGGFAAREYPRELRVRRIEGVCMDSFMAASNVLRLLEKCCGKRGLEEAAPVPEKPVQAKKSASAKPAQEKPAAEKKPAPAKKPTPAPVPVPAKPAPVQPAPTQPAVIYAPESDFETAPVEGGCSITKYMGKGGEVNVPPTIGGRKVVEIGKRAFKDCSSLTSITLPDGMTSIGYGAFRDCSSLTSITLPDGMTSIGDDAFRDCSSLTSITLPDSVTSIGDSAFDGCSSLTSITLPDGVTSIGDFAFSDCSSLTSITLPESVTRIGDFAFEGCSSLTKVTLPPRVKLGMGVFVGCPWQPPRKKLFGIF